MQLLWIKSPFYILFEMIYHLNTFTLSISEN